MNEMTRRSSSGEESDDGLEHFGITATRRTWQLSLNEQERKHTIMADVDSSNAMDTSGGLTATKTGRISTNSTTPQHSTVSWLSPTTSDSLREQQQQQHRQQQEFLREKRQSSEISIDLVWGEGMEAQEEGKPNRTPSTILTRAPHQAGWSESSSPATVRRRLSLHEGGRRSGTLPAGPAATLLTAQQQETPTPLRRMPHLFQQPRLYAMEPATVSRELPVRPGYALPSPSTPLWPSLDEEEDDEEEESNNSNNNITLEGLNTLEGAREAVEADTDAVMCLPLSHRPSSFVHRVAPSSVSSVSVSVSPPSVVVASSQEGRRLFTTSNNPHGSGGGVHDTVPMSQKSRRRAEETLQRIKADAWAQETRRFFEEIDRRPLLAVTVDEQ